MPRRCSECGQEFVGRKDAQTCSTRCRVARYRRLAKKGKTTMTVLSHVQAERAMQVERWDDSDKEPADWDGLLAAWLAKVTSTPDKRYVRLVQLAAIAVAAAEAEWGNK